MTTPHSDTADTTPRDGRATAATPPATTGETADGVTRASDGVPRVSAIPRGLTCAVSSGPLQQRIWQRSLMVADRFRVIRTVDIAVSCFPERTFKAALTAAQRAVRGLVKADLLRRYRTDRFMTVYGLTQRGTDWLNERDIESSPSVRRVSDMTNPEHALWAQFLVLCFEARGLRAMTEHELLQALNAGRAEDLPPVQGMLTVTAVVGGKSRAVCLRPDAVGIEADGVTHIEVDRSARGSLRAASLRALCLAMGSKTESGEILRRVVVFTKTERIKNRVLATLFALASQTEAAPLMLGRRQLKSVAPGVWQVWQTIDDKLADGRVRLLDVLAGHVLVQELPVWLPKLRIDGRGGHSQAGWLGENYLPYQRPAGCPQWTSPSSPLTAGRSVRRPETTTCTRAKVPE